ncbi:hypothetical protein [Virgibacillus sp. Bac332]|nr:hypothetical protein [Virgibacillus sp. Bac332]
MVEGHTVKNIMTFILDENIMTFILDENIKTLFTFPQMGALIE